MYRSFKMKMSILLLIMSFIGFGFINVKAQVQQVFLPLPETVSCIDAQYDLSVGSKDYVLHGNVQKLQHFLFENNIMYHAPTGYFGPITQDSLRRYQSLRNLYPTGVFDVNTRRVIAQETCKQSEVVNNTGTVVYNPSTNPNYTYTPPVNTQNPPTNTQTPPTNTQIPPTNTQNPSYPPQYQQPTTNIPTLPSSQNPYSQPPQTPTSDNQVYYRITEQMLGFNTDSTAPNTQNTGYFCSLDNKYYQDFTSYSRYCVYNPNTTPTTPTTPTDPSTPTNPTTPQYKTCPNGTTVLATQVCPTQTPGSPNYNTQTYSAQTFKINGKRPTDLVKDSSGNIYTVNSESNDISKITPSGISTTFAGTINSPRGLVIDSQDNIYTTSMIDETVIKITSFGTMSVLGKTGKTPVALAIDSVGNIYTANFGSNDVSKVTPSGASSILGNTGTWPNAITLDPAGNVYVVNNRSENVTKITPAGVSSVIGKTGTNPQGIAVDSSDNVYVSNSYDPSNITKITPAGATSLIPMTQRYPYDIIVDPLGNLYTANFLSHNVTKITPNGTETIIGKTGIQPHALIMDNEGNIYTANYGAIENTITKLTPVADQSGNVTPTSPNVPATPVAKIKITGATVAEYSWNKVANATGYIYKLNIAGSGERVGTTAGIGFQSSGINPNTNIILSVAAYNSYGTSTFSSATATTFPTLHTPKTPNLSAANITSNSMTINWDLDPYATMFWHQVKGGNGQESSFLYAEPTPRILLWNLLPDTTYTIEVMANNTDALSERAQISVKTLPITYKLATPAPVVNRTSTSDFYINWPAITSPGGNTVRYECKVTPQNLSAYYEHYYDWTGCPSTRSIGLDLKINTIASYQVGVRAYSVGAGGVRTDETSRPATIIVTREN